MKSQGVESEVMLQLVPQELTDLRPVGTGTEPPEQRGEHAVVLVLHGVGDADRVPLVEQPPSLLPGRAVSG
ncbi:hypothetical protein ACIHCM_17310 [Streptomyces sp. NPDC052023]|uniref:hypothetical protein n=1 Tax=Streptomyces sp. NPDC052023 TaxID=3365681 RepID=UPI0037CE8156